MVFFALFQQVLEEAPHTAVLNVLKLAPDDTFHIVLKTVDSPVLAEPRGDIISKQIYQERITAGEVADPDNRPRIIFYRLI